MAERMRLDRSILAATLVAVVVAACGSGSTATTSTPSPGAVAPSLGSAASVSAATPSASPVIATSAAHTSASVAPTSTPTPAPSAAPASSGPLLPGGTSVVLVTPAAGNGARPQLAWQPVDGAATYRVTVFDENGRPYWTWEGAEPSTYFGGGAQPLLEEAPGPLLRAGMTWVVFAAGTDGTPIAASDIAPIAP